MLDISNKLHALVDEFVSTLTSECDTLANNISSQNCNYVAQCSGAEAATAPRLSNRSPTEVLNGLRRPSEPHLVGNRHQEEKPHVEPVKLDFMEAATNSKLDGRFVRAARDMEPSPTSLEETDTQHDGRSIDIGSSYTYSNDEAKHGRRASGMAAIGKHMEHIEILSSDHSSDDSLRAYLKSATQRHQKRGR